MTYNKQSWEFILTEPDEYAIEILRSLFDVLYKDVLNKKLNDKNLLTKVRVIILETGLDNTKDIKDKIVILLKQNAKNIIEDKELDPNLQATGEHAIRNIFAEKKIKEIEETFWITETEKQALFRVEDSAYKTPTLADITDKAKWNYYLIAKAKLRILNVLKIPI